MSTNDDSPNPEPDRIMPFDGPDEFPPLSALVAVDFGAASRPGTNRSVNEDHYFVLKLGRHQETLLSSLTDPSVLEPFKEYAYGIVVADGMNGPNSAGELASRLALVTLHHLIQRFGRWNLRVDTRIAAEIMARAERFYRRVDATLLDRNQQNEDKPVMRTTLTAVFSGGRDLFFAHVGHSRAYLFRGGALLRLTRDHTIGRNQKSKVPMGPLVDVNKGGHDLGHILTDAIGMGGTIGPAIDLERIHLIDSDLVLVCTNGLTDMVDEEVIGEVMASAESPRQKAGTLVDLAIAMGGDDDVTAVVAAYHIPERAPGA